MSTTDTTGYEGPLAQIEAALDQLVSVEDWRLTDEQVLAEVVGLGVLAERMAGLRLRRAGAVESRGICKARGGTTADHLMVSERTSLRAARAYVYFSRHPPSLPPSPPASGVRWVRSPQPAARLGADRATPPLIRARPSADRARRDQSK